MERLTILCFVLFTCSLGEEKDIRDIGGEIVTISSDTELQRRFDKSMFSHFSRSERLPERLGGREMTIHELCWMVNLMIVDYEDKVPPELHSLVRTLVEDILIIINPDAAKYLYTTTRRALKDQNRRMELAEDFFLKEEL